MLWVAGRGVSLGLVCCSRSVGLDVSMGSRQNNMDLDKERKGSHSQLGMLKASTVLSNKVLSHWRHWILMFLLKLGSSLYSIRKFSIWYIYHTPTQLRGHRWNRDLVYRCLHLKILITASNYFMNDFILLKLTIHWQLKHFQRPVTFTSNIQFENRKSAEPTWDR